MMEALVIRLFILGLAWFALVITARAVAAWLGRGR